MNAPVSSPTAPLQSRWSLMRDSSAMITRMYCSPRRQLDAQQPLDRAVPGHVVGHRRDVVHPVGDGDVLVVVEALADLFEAGMEIADVGHGIDHPFAVELEHEPQRGVRGRMLRAEVQRPEVVLRLAGRFRRRATSIGVEVEAAILMCFGRACLAAVARSGREIVPLAAALQRIILAQRKRGELLGHQDPPQIGMPVELDAEHVPHFALHPIGPFPQRHGGGNGQIRLVRETRAP